MAYKQVVDPQGREGYVVVPDAHAGEAERHGEEVIGDPDELQKAADAVEESKDKGALHSLNQQAPTELRPLDVESPKDSKTVEETQKATLEAAEADAEVADRAVARDGEGNPAVTEDSDKKPKAKSKK